ncbi:MAG: cation-transporting P-type ATPase [Patescibacteria group bacterium]|nr:cation-transporting P-type ATPase [Patescibacteria group bacterium]MDE2437966.1 cation-transporting P-type ATPase [Patescibacteria group bacterium]
MNTAPLNKEEVLKLDQQALFERLQTSINGLSNKEASKRIQQCGPNLLGKKRANALKVLLHQFQSSLIYLLIAAVLISYGIHDYSDGTVILVILLINTSLGFYQEYKSEKILEKLSQFITKQVRIKRDGDFELYDESKIVPGDIVTIREGDIVPADIRLLETEQLQVNESQLTGESVPIIKSITEKSGIIDENFLLFTGSIIEKGMGTGVIYATGKNTELGTIATLSTGTKKQTQYEKFLQSFSAFLMRFVLLGLGLIFIFKLVLNGGFSNISNLFLFIIVLAVSTVPEVLPVIATVTLSRGALQLAKKYVIVKRLSALEDFGNVNLLCTDKTGTITENKLVITKLTSDDNELFQKLAFARITVLKGRKRRTQDSYDNAFLNYVPKSIQQEATHFTIIKELPFDPEARRDRAIIEDTRHKKYYLVTMGASESLFEIAHTNNKTEYLHHIAQEGRSGLRHFALAYKEVAYTEGFDILKNEHGLTFLGYVSLEDPLRPTAKSSIEHAEKLGIKVKILTGDSREVAQYAGTQIGLVGKDCKVYLGDELEKMSEDEFNVAVEQCNVFARVSPRQKFNIIRALKEHYVVAYQGDGINDAPALKLADVAIAVNSATDIAKESADVVLLHKGLGVIIDGITYGRSIFVNVNKYIKYTMLNNFGMFITLSILFLLSKDLPLLPVQVLLNNLIGDVPLITISSDTVEDRDVIRPERHNVSELLFLALILGIPTALFELFYFSIVHSEPVRLMQTSLYAFFTLQALIIFYAIRNKDHFWNAKIPSLLLDVSFFLAFVFSLSIIYIPTFQKWFSLTSLSGMSIAVIVALTGFYLFATDFIKVWYYKSFTKIKAQ